MARDIKIIEAMTGLPDFQVLGKDLDTGLMLLQRVYVLLFSRYTELSYRSLEAAAFLNFLDGGNIPDDDLLLALLNIACSLVLALLDELDNLNILSLACLIISGTVYITLTLTDGTTVQGKLNV